MTLISLEKLIHTLHDQFYVNIPFPLENNVIEEAVQAFFKFLDEKESVKSHINFSIAPLHRRGDVGYKHRDAADHIYDDSKDFFHYHPAVFKQYPEFLETHPIVNNFMLKAKPIWDLTAHTIADLLQTLDAEFPGIYEKVFGSPTEEIHILIRFLKYEWGISGKYLAKPHFDAGSLTLAIAESTPGLRIGSCPENLTLVEHQPHNALFMISSNFQTIAKTDNLSPGWHDVIQLNENLIGKPYARWAVVAFIEAQNVEALSRAETHKYYNPESQEVA